MKARLLVRIAHAHQQALAFTVEVEGRREVDREGQVAWQIRYRLRDDDLPAQGRDGQVDVGHRCDLLRPRSGRADDGVSRNGPPYGHDTGDDTVLDLNARDGTVRHEGGSVAPRAGGVAENDRLRGAVPVGRGPPCSQKALGTDQG